MIPFLLTLLLSNLGVTPDLQLTDEPFAVSAPRTEVEGWTRFVGLQPLTTGAIAIRCQDVPVAPGVRGRVDILQRDGKRWTWLATYQYGPELAIPQADFDRGVLVRFEGSPIYLWNQVPARMPGPIVLKRFRNVSIDAPPAATLSLYVASEQSPRTLVNGRFRLVPVATALACATAAIESRCIEVGPMSEKVALSFGSGDDARVLLVEPQAEDRFSVIAKGNVAIRPRNVGGSIAQVLPWVVISLSQKGISWSDVLIDRSGRDLALERLQGSSLVPPPAFTEVRARHERGLLIRPYVGTHREPLSDPSALLLVFAADDGTLFSQVPLVTSSPEHDGNFHLSTLAPGTYVLKLLSSAATTERLTVSAMVGVPLDVVFPSGPTVRGRVVRASGGSPTDPVTIEIGIDGPFQQALKSGDLMDTMRSATADENGNFSVVIAQAGRYRLRARWGSATAERVFEIAPSTTDVDLGDIALKSGTALHGTVPGCHGGQATAIVVPDLSKPPTFDTLAALIDVDGRFLIQGLLPGRWSVLIQCEGKPVKTAPQVVTIPEGGEPVVEFVRTQR